MAQKLNFGIGKAAAGSPEATSELYWNYKPTFGRYLKGLRLEAGLSLREAASALGTSFSRLQKLEVGARVSTPLALLHVIANFYGRPSQEVVEQAGVFALVPDGFDDDTDYQKDFPDLVLMDELRPAHMTTFWLESFVLLQKQQWVEFAHRLDGLIFRQGPSMRLALSTPYDSSSAGGESPEDEVPVHVTTGGWHFLGTQSFLWKPRAGFGSWLRQLREEDDLTLREAARELGVSFSLLQRLETGANIRPTIGLLMRVVSVYQVRLEEACEAAGVEIERLDGLLGLDQEEVAFGNLVLYPRLRPVGMNPEWMLAWSRLQQRQLIEFGWKLERHLLKGGPRVKELLARLRATRKGGQG